MWIIMMENYQIIRENLGNVPIFLQRARKYGIAMKIIKKIHFQKKKNP